MKTQSFRHLFAGAAFSAITLLPLALVQAQTTVTTTEAAPATTTATTVQTTNSAGTIQEFTPGSSRIVLRTTTGSPVTYSYSKKTTFVDSTGNVVNYESIKAGEPTTVYYTTENGEPVVSKVVVNRTVAPTAVTKTESTETTTTASSHK